MTHTTDSATAAVSRQSFSHPLRQDAHLICGSRAEVKLIGALPLLLNRGGAWGLARGLHPAGLHAGLRDDRTAV